MKMASMSAATMLESERRDLPWSYLFLPEPDRSILHTRGICPVETIGIG